MNLRTHHILTALLVTSSAVSCMEDLPTEHDAVLPDENIPSIEGTVCDESDNPIEYIMVSLKWGSGIEDGVTYTSSEGRFKTIIPEEIVGVESIVSVTLTDVDETENGGEFETLTDQVMLFQNDTTSNVVLDYRMNRATPSESSPQS